MRDFIFISSKLLIMCMLMTSCTQSKVDKVFTRSDYIKGGKNHPIFHFGEVNEWLAERGGDSLYSLFMVPKRLALMPRPQILIFNEKGEMLVELCAAHFSSKAELKEDVERRGRGKKLWSDNLFDLLEAEFLNGDEIRARLPQDVDRYVLIPWGKGDTMQDPHTKLTPYEDWIKPVMEVVEESDMNMVIIWEAIAYTDLHDITRDEFSNLRFEAMQERFPDNFKEDHEVVRDSSQHVD